jgi:hypothetical protein
MKVRVILLLQILHFRQNLEFNFYNNFLINGSFRVMLLIIGLSNIFVGRTEDFLLTVVCTSLRCCNDLNNGSSVSTVGYETVLIARHCSCCGVRSFTGDIRRIRLYVNLASASFCYLPTKTDSERISPGVKTSYAQYFQQKLPSLWRWLSSEMLCRVVW